MKTKSPLLTVNESSIIEFNRFHFVLKNLLPSGVMHEVQRYYSSLPLVRQTVRKLTNTIVTDFSVLFLNDGDTSVQMSQGDTGRGFMLGKMIDRLEYFNIQGDVITVVTSEQRFAREPVASPLLKSLVAHTRSLIAAASSAEEAGRGGDAIAGIFPGAADIDSLPASLTCRRCGRCCSAYEVICTSGEMERIASFLGIPIRELNDRFLGAEPYTWSEHSALILKSPRSAAKGKGRGGECMFLRDEPSGVKSCSIYESRPAACRSYLPGTALCRRDYI